MMEEIIEFMKMDNYYRNLEYMAKYIFHVPVKELFNKYGVSYEDYLTHKAEMEEE